MENKETILKLYDVFIDEIYKMTPNKLEISKEIANIEDELNQSLTDEQKQKLEVLRTYDNEKNELVYKQIFISAYSLATKLLVEGLDINRKKD